MPQNSPLKKIEANHLSPFIELLNNWNFPEFNFKKFS